MFTTGETVCLAEWIIVLKVIFYFFSHMAQYAEEVALFKQLPLHVQETMLGRILARNEDALEAVEENQGIFEKLGFEFDLDRVLQKADLAAKEIAMKKKLKSKSNR